MTGAGWIINVAALGRAERLNIIVPRGADDTGVGDGLVRVRRQHAAGDFRCGVVVVITRLAAAQGNQQK